MSARSFASPLIYRTRCLHIRELCAVFALFERGARLSMREHGPCVRCTGRAPSSSFNRALWVIHRAILKKLEGALARFRGPPWRRRRHVQTGQLDGNFRATMYTYGCKHMRSHPYKKSATWEISSSLLSLRAKCRIVVLALLATVAQIGERREATFHSISECLSDIKLHLEIECLFLPSTKPRP